MQCACCLVPALLLCTLLHRSVGRCWCYGVGQVAALLLHEAQEGDPLTDAGVLCCSQQMPSARPHSAQGQSLGCYAPSNSLLTVTGCLLSTLLRCR